MHWARWLALGLLACGLAVRAASAQPPSRLDPGPVPTPLPLEAPPESTNIPLDAEPWIELGPENGAFDDGRWFRRRFLPPSNGRHRGIGHPLERESWLTRPLSVSTFGGAWIASPPLENRVDGSTGYITGLRLGWDVDHFWGLETRFSFSSFGLSDANQPLRPMGDAKVFQLDTNYLWYPLGDAQWRPYFSLGLGFGNYSFYDENDHLSRQTAFTLPLGGGFKYRANERWVVRVEVLDNLVFDAGSQLDAMHNVSISGGLEARLGTGPRRSYYPWNPSRNWR